MTRSNWKRRYNLDRTTINFKNYKKQRYICVNILRKSKKKYFNNIDVKNVTDNKKFLKTFYTKFLSKCKTANTIILVEDEKVLQDEKATANTFNNYFTDVTHSVGLKKRNIGFFVFLTGLNVWIFIYELSGCGIDSSCSYLNLRYRGCFEQGAPWHRVTWQEHTVKKCFFAPQFY